MLVCSPITLLMSITCANASLDSEESYYQFNGMIFGDLISSEYLRDRDIKLTVRSDIQTLFSCYCRMKEYVKERIAGILESIRCDVYYNYFIAEFSEAMQEPEDPRFPGVKHSIFRNLLTYLVNNIATLSEHPNKKRIYFFFAEIWRIGIQNMDECFLLRIIRTLLNRSSRIQIEIWYWDVLVKSSSDSTFDRDTNRIALSSIYQSVNGPKMLVGQRKEIVMAISSGFAWYIADPETQGWSMCYILHKENEDNLKRKLVELWSAPCVISYSAFVHLVSHLNSKSAYICMRFFPILMFKMLLLSHPGMFRVLLESVSSHTVVVTKTVGKEIAMFHRRLLGVMETVIMCANEEHGVFINPELKEE